MNTLALLSLSSKFALQLLALWLTVYHHSKRNVSYTLLIKHLMLCTKSIPALSFWILVHVCEMSLSLRKVKQGSLESDVSGSVQPMRWELSMMKADVTHTSRSVREWRKTQNSDLTWSSCKNSSSKPLAEVFTCFLSPLGSPPHVSCASFCLYQPPLLLLTHCTV